MLDAVIGLGANLGDRRLTLSRSVAFIAARMQVVGESALFETRPVGGPPQPDFLNAAVRVTTHDDPFELLRRLLRIEAIFGRQRRQRWEARELDLDILWIAGCNIESPELTVPHPRLMERAFALLPLREVAPDARHPVSNALLLETLVPDPEGVRILCGPGWSGSGCQYATSTRRGAV